MLCVSDRSRQKSSLHDDGLYLLLPTLVGLTIVCKNSCEINWLGPEPDRENSGYEVYDQELQSMQEDIFCFEGYHQPPAQDDYKRLCEEYYGI